MKKSHIALIIGIAVLIGAMITTISDSSSYADFQEAFAHQGEEFHVVGHRVDDKPTIYEPTTNPDLFVFHMRDINDVEKKVFLHRSKPQDFERSEQIVLIGEAREDGFHAEEILLKCPSKYQDGEVVEKQEAAI